MRAVIFSVVPLCVAAIPPQPAPLPVEFYGSYNESFLINSSPLPLSSGAWYYAFDRELWRADHNAPQMNNVSVRRRESSMTNAPRSFARVQFCACADNTTSASCLLLFQPDGMYVDYPGNHAACCRACGVEEGCSPLTPTWMSSNPNRTFVGTFTSALGRTCYEWCVPGDYAAADCWAFSVDNGKQTPCQYHEVSAWDVANGILSVQ